VVRQPKAQAGSAAADAARATTSVGLDGDTPFPGWVVLSTFPVAEMVPAEFIQGVGRSVYVTSAADGDVLDFTGSLDGGSGPSEAWARIGGPGARFAGGDALYGLTPDRQAVNRYDLRGQRWEQIGGPARLVYSGAADGVFATSPGERDLWHYTHRPGGGSWRRIGSPGADFAADPYFGLFGLTPDRQAVYRWKGGSDWEEVGGPAHAIEPGLAVDPASRDVWRYRGEPMRWERIGGPGAAFTRARTYRDRFGEAIYALSPRSPGPSTIWRYRGVPGSWEPFGGPARAILATESGLFAIDSDDRRLWFRRHPPF
jgi:hypothetical protein